ncbi:MAG TPA: helix-turn-helix domain-containing protein, partial [Pseudogracilibacillus sp.]|nr:helix-turn-helix domain-containing protein [Pseudogracilibacillus sp.]
IQQELLSTAETVEYLGISRQTLHSLVQRGKLTPIKVTGKDKLFLKEGVQQRENASKNLKKKYRPYDDNN